MSWLDVATEAVGFLQATELWGILQIAILGSIAIGLAWRVFGGRSDDGEF